MATSFDGDYAGWVYKQGSLIPNWKKRFMVLRGKQLTYYDTDKINAKTKEKGSFTVITAELSTEIQNGLLVHGRGGRVLKLYTDSAEATSEWYNMILDATTQGGSERMSLQISMHSNGSGSNMSSMDEIPLDHLDTLDELQVVQHSGWLKKEGARVKSWKRRYFTLRGNALSYFNSEDTGTNAKGYGHVKAVEVNPTVTRGLNITFDNNRVLRVSARTEEDQQVWLLKLSDAIEAANAENNNVRQSLAARNSFRASMPVMNKSPARRMGSLPMRHSVAAVPQRPLGIVTDNNKSFRVTSSMSSSLSSSGSFDKQQSTDSYKTTISVPEEYTSFLETDSDDEYLSDESEGDWI